MASTTPTTVSAGLAWTTLASGEKNVTMKMEQQGVLEVYMTDGAAPAATAGRKGAILDYADGGLIEFGDVEAATIYARPLDTSGDQDIEVTVFAHTPA